MKGKRASTFVMIAIITVVMIGIVLLVNRTTIFQEGNPLPVLGGIWQVSVVGEPYSSIDGEPPKWIAKTGRHDELFSHIESAYSVKFKEEKDDTFRFEGDGGKLTVTARQYSRSYQIWEILKKE